MITYSIAFHSVPDTNPLHPLYILLANAAIFFLCMWHEKFSEWLKDSFEYFLNMVGIEIEEFFILIAKFAPVLFLCWFIIHYDVINNQSFSFAVSSAMIMISVSAWSKEFLLAHSRNKVNTCLEGSSNDFYRMSYDVTKFGNIATNYKKLKLKNTPEIINNKIKSSCKQIDEIGYKLLTGEDKQETEKLKKVRIPVTMDSDSGF